MVWAALPAIAYVMHDFQPKPKEPMIELDLRIKHYFSGREYAKHMFLEKGHYADTHKHEYDHLSILAIGVAEVEIDGVKTVYTAPDCITIKAGVEHKITALEDVTWFCIHATTETDPAKVDHVLIKEG
jgi:quercetin dioxygenase-like cupin family protein